MNDIELTQNLQKIAKLLDEKGHFKQADKLSEMIVKLAQSKDNKSRPHVSHTTDGKLFWNINNRKFPIPVENTTEIIDGKEFKLNFDESQEKFYWYNDKSNQAFYVDNSGRIHEARPKRYDFWKQIGGRKLFGDWRLPNLNKFIPIEPFLRKELIPEIAKIVRPVGDVAKPLGRAVTDPLTEVAEDIGITVPGAKSEPQEKLEKKYGPASDRAQIQPTVPVVDEYKKTPRGTNVDIEDIRTAADLLFWAMAISNDVTYEAYDRRNDHIYYSPQTKNKISDFINLMGRSKYVLRKNKSIKDLVPAALSLLDSKIKELHPESKKEVDMGEIEKSETLENTNLQSDKSPLAPVSTNETPSQMGSPYGG